jgi:PAS domain S-box-containing protein
MTSPTFDPSSFRALVEALPSIVYAARIDPARQPVYVNAAIACLGYTSDEWCAAPGLWALQLHPDDRDRVLLATSKCIASGGPLNEIYRLIARDGSTKWFRDSGHVVRGEAGGPSLWQGMMVDVTEHRVTLGSWRASEERQCAQLDRASDGIAVIDALWTASVREESERQLRAQFEHIPVPTALWQAVNGCFVLADFNEAAAVASRSIDGELIGCQAKEVYPDIDGLEDDMRRCLRDHVVIHREVECAAKLGRDARSFSLTLGAIQPDRVIVHAAETTERRLLESQLRQAQKMEAVGQLAGGVAHDFNNLLTVIRGHAEFLRRGEPDTITWHEDVAEILAAVTRASLLTRQLLAFSRKQVLQPRLLDLNDVIGELVSMVQRLIGEDITIDLRLSAYLGEVRADHGQMEQVLMNLAVNSRDAMPMGGRLTVATSNLEIATRMTAGDVELAPGSYVVFSVTDTGTGIDEHIRGRVFEPFFTTKEPGKGTGLGLATVFGIVTQSGGAVALDSELGIGTTVRVYLPRTDIPVPFDEPVMAGATAGS